MIMAKKSLSSSNAGKHHNIEHKETKSKKQQRFCCVRFKVLTRFYNNYLIAKTLTMNFASISAVISTTPLSLSRSV